MTNTVRSALSSARLPSAAFVVATLMAACHSGEQPPEAVGKTRALGTDTVRAIADESAEAVQAVQERAAEAARKAELEALEAAEQRAKRPVLLDDVSLIAAPGGNQKPIELTAKATFNQTIDKGTYVHAKLRCKDGDTVVVDSAYLNPDHRAPKIHEIPAGGTTDLRMRAFTRGAAVEPGVCEIEFLLAGLGDGVSIPLGRMCSRGGTVTKGGCGADLPASKPKGQGSITLAGDQLDVRLVQSANGATSVEVDYRVSVEDQPAPMTSVTAAGACKVEGRWLTEIETARVGAKPFKYAPGERVSRRARLFDFASFELSSPPEMCDVALTAWIPVDGKFGSSKPHELARACSSAGKLQMRACEGAPSREGEPGPLSADAVSLEAVTVAAVAPYGSAGKKLRVELEADVLLKQPVVPTAALAADLSCKVGKETREDDLTVMGAKLSHVAPGQTIRVRGVAFTREALSEPPESCELHVHARKGFQASAPEPASLGHWCMRDGKTKRGKC